MKTYSWPKPIRRKPELKTVYIRDKDGTVTWNCAPERATEKREMVVSNSWSWPITFLLEIADEGDKLLCVLSGRRWVHRPHTIYVYWRGLFRRRFLTLKVFCVPQRWWSWRVLIKSKKLFWYGKRMWGEL